jgi:hypothetical protein
MVHEAYGRNDLDLTATDIRFVDNAAHASKVISVGVGIDHCHNWPLAELFIDEFKRSPRGLCSSKRIKDNPAGVTFL